MACAWGDYARAFIITILWLMPLSVSVGPWCAVGNYANAASGSCVACPAGSYQPTEVYYWAPYSFDWVCGSGWVYVNSQVANGQGVYYSSSTGAYMWWWGRWWLTGTSDMIGSSNYYCDSATSGSWDWDGGTEANQYLQAINVQNCPPCSTGNFCPSGSAVQVACPAGSYCSGPSVKVICPMGSYCPAGSTTALQCAASVGYYCPAGSVSPASAVPCPAGFYCLGGAGGATPCSACSAGLTGQSTSGLACRACTSLATPGTYSPQGVYPVGVGASNFQGFCPANTGLCAVDQQGGAGWLYGLIGYCCDTLGSPALPTFVASAWQGAGVSVAGIKPSTGIFFAQMQYPGLGSGFALLNYDGSMAYTVATAGSSGLTCDVAYGSGVVTGGVIVGLSGGYGTGMDTLGIQCGQLQMPCPAGTYSTGIGATQCISCASGLTSADGATACTSCPVGTRVQYSSFLAPAPVYSASSGSTASAGLGSSSYWTTSGSGAWLQIDLGNASIVKSSVTRGPGVQQITSYTLQSSSDGATWASAYTVQGPSGNREYFVHSSTTAAGMSVYNFLANSVVARYWRLTPVGYGSVQTISWTLELAQICLPLNTVCSTCKVCGTGDYLSTPCTATSDSLCIKCGVCGTGNYTSSVCTSRNNTVCTNCTACGTGKYVSTACNSTSDALCTSCPVGSFSSAPGASSCSPCAAGKFSLNGASQCSDCGAGRYGTGTGMSTCLTCDAGTFSWMSVSSFCTNCTAGTYSTGTGFTAVSNCSGCSSGAYGSGTGGTICSSCAAGTYTSSTGNVLCTSCSAGFVSTGTGVTSTSGCTGCATGNFASSTGVTVCSTCASGKPCTYLKVGLVLFFECVVLVSFYCLLLVG